MKTINGIQQLVSPIISGGTIDGTAIGGTTPAAGTFTDLDTSGTTHHTLSATKPVIMAGATIGTLTGVSISNEDPSVLTLDATIDDGLAVGDVCIVNSGTNATAGVYIVKSIVANTSVTLDRQAATGACTDGNITYINGEGLTVTSLGAMHLSNGTGASIIRQYAEPGLGSRTTIGLDETARTLVICDAGDVDTDLGLDVSTDPKMYVFNASLDASASLKVDNLTLRPSFAEILYTDGRLKLYGYQGVTFYQRFLDVAAGNAFDFLSETNRELTDTDGEQSFIYVEPKINQSSTAAYNGIKVNVLETTPGTSIGTGATGDGNNLMNLQRESVTKFRVDRDGRIVMAESSAPAALADHGFLYVKDVSETAEVFAADAAATEAQLTAHNDTLFNPDPNEAYPWMPYFKNHALGKEVGFDMSRALRDLEAITGNKYIYYNDVPKTIDLIKSRRDQWKAQWIKDNITEVEVSKAEALEDYDVEIIEKTLQEVEVPESEAMRKVVTVEGEGEEAKETISYTMKDGYEKRDGNYYITKMMPTKITDEVSYSLDDMGEVKETKTPVYQTKTVTKKHVKDNVRFDEKSGKFYAKSVPTAEDAEQAAKGGYIAKELPKYLKDRLVVEK